MPSTGAMLDAVLALMDDDVEIDLALGCRWREPAIAATTESVAGCEEPVRRLSRLACEALEMRDLGDFTMAAVRVRGHGGESGAPVDQVIWQVGRVAQREARPVAQPSAREAEALEAVGLSE